MGILVGIFGLIEDGLIKLDTPVSVRNRFFSLVNNKMFKVASSRDACSTLYALKGQNSTVYELAYHMIVSSSNLATNLLIDLVGVEFLNNKLKQLYTPGIELLRGVEDEAAWEADINNSVTANGLLYLFRLLYESKGISSALSEKMLDILFQQNFNNGIPIGIPSKLRQNTKIAHKTGEISTVAHDTGLIYIPERKPYALTVLTQRIPGKSKSNQAIQQISKLVYKNFIKTKTEERSTNDAQ